MSGSFLLSVHLGAKNHELQFRSSFGDVKHFQIMENTYIAFEKTFKLQILMSSAYPEIVKAVQDFKECLGDEATFLPVTTEEQLVAFEDRFKVQIPEDFRWFLLNIANGIEYKPLFGFVINRVNFDKYFFRQDENNPAIPFMLTKARVFGNEEEVDEEKLNFEYPNEKEYLEDYEDKDLKYRNGDIYLGNSNFLVINGKEYGHVWRDGYEYINMVNPYFDEAKGNQRLNFSDFICKELYRLMENHKSSQLTPEQIAEQEDFERYMEKYSGQKEEEKELEVKDPEVKDPENPIPLKPWGKVLNWIIDAIRSGM